MNPGELWSFEDGSSRLVLSHPTYNASKGNLVVTCAVIDEEPKSFQPFAVRASGGYVLSDRLLTHPRHWLTEQRGELTGSELAAVHGHLQFLLGL